MRKKTGISDFCAEVVAFPEDLSNLAGSKSDK